MHRKPLNIDACPTPQELESYVAKKLIGRRNEEVFLHLKHCGDCLRYLAKITQTPSPDEIIKKRSRGRFWKKILSFWPLRRQ